MQHHIRGRLDVPFLLSEWISRRRKAFREVEEARREASESYTLMWILKLIKPIPPKGIENVVEISRGCKMKFETTWSIHQEEEVS